MNFSNVTDNDEQFKQHSAELVTAMRLFYSIFVTTGIIFGLLGSLTTLLVVLRGCRQLRISTRIFQGLLGMADAGVLLTSALRYLLLTLTKLDLRELNPVACRMHTFATYLVMDLAIWALTAMTFERFVLVTWPTLGHGNSPRRTRHYALLVCMSLTTLGIAKNFVLLFRIWLENEIDAELEGSYCLSDYLNNFDPSVLSVFDVVLSFALPNTLVIVACVGILKALTKNRVGGAEVDENDVAIQARFATKLMLGVGVAFLVTSMPSFVYTTLSSIPDSFVSEYDLRIHEGLVYEGLMILQLTGFMSRFYVCALSSKYFRDEVRRLIVWS